MYDLAIIGGGPGGYTAAFEAARCGMSVLLFEKEALGGTCLNRGCVPTKYLAHIAELNRALTEAYGNGLHIGSSAIEFGITQQRNREIIAELKNGLLQRLQDCGVTIVNGTAELKDRNLIVCGGVSYESSNVIIASGSRSVRLRESMVTGDEVLHIDRIPHSMSIVGGGSIAVELAEIFNGLGTEVSLYIRAERILQRWDKDIAVGLTQSLKKRGIRIYSKCDAAVFDNIRDELVVSAVGRKPVLDHLNRALFATGSDGGILTNTSGQTMTKGLYAIGDVVSGSSGLAHIAMEQGTAAIFHIKEQKDKKTSIVIRCIYTKPEIACVGLSQKEAIEQGRNVIAARQTMYANARTLITASERGFIKIVAEKGTRKLLGAQFMCERASDMISELATAIQHGFTVDDMLEVTRPHPSYAEAVSEALCRARDALDNEL